MSYQYEVERRKKKLANVSVSPDQAIYQDAAKHLKSLNLEAQALNVSDHIPNFTLKNELGKTVNIQDVLKKDQLSQRFIVAHGVHFVI